MTKCRSVSTKSSSFLGSNDSNATISRFHIRNTKHVVISERLRGQTVFPTEEAIINLYISVPYCRYLHTNISRN